MTTNADLARERQDYADRQDRLSLADDPRLAPRVVVGTPEEQAEISRLILSGAIYRHHFDQQGQPMSAPHPKNNPDCRDADYLGDGVYVSHDGYYLWLDLRGQDETTMIALEPAVFDRLAKYVLTKYAKRLKEEPSKEKVDAQ